MVSVTSGVLPADLSHDSSSDDDDDAANVEESESLRASTSSTASTGSELPKSATIQNDQNGDTLWRGERDQAILAAQRTGHQQPSLHSMQTVRKNSKASSHKGKEASKNDTTAGHEQYATSTTYQTARSHNGAEVVSPSDSEVNSGEETPTPTRRKHGVGISTKTHKSRRKVKDVWKVRVLFCRILSSLKLRLAFGSLNLQNSSASRQLDEVLDSSQEEFAKLIMKDRR